MVHLRYLLETYSIKMVKASYEFQQQASHSTSCLGLKPRYNNVSADSYSKGRRICIYVLSVVEALLFGAICSGWSAYGYMYEDSGVYANLCMENATQPERFVYVSYLG